MDNGKLCVLYQSNNTYMVPTQLSMYSLMKNNQECGDLKIYLISDGICAENQERIDNLAASFHRTVHWIDGKDMEQALIQYGVKLYNGSYTAYMKLLAVDRIQKENPEAKGLLYIDSDTLVLGSVEPLYSYDYAGANLSAVYEYTPKPYRDKIGIRGNSFNTGVLMFHLDAWKENCITERIIAHLRDPDFISKTQLADQDVLNAVLEDSTRALPPQYNLTTWFYIYRDREKFVKRLRMNECFYSQEEIEAAISSPVIVHYLDPWTGRPWDEPNANPFSKVYYQYLDECMPGEKVETRKRTGIRKLAKNMLVWMHAHLPSWFMRDVCAFLSYLSAKYQVK